jgi:hypothetical protein
MKISAGLLILLYGGLLTFGCVALPAFGSGMAGIYGIKDGLLFVAAIAVAALLIWVPLPVPFADSSTQADGGLR